MRKYQEANLGGLEITPIYGIHGYEDRFKDFLSPEWVDLFLYTLQAPVLDILIYAEPAKKVFSQGVFAFVANIIIVGVLGSLLGLGYTKIGAKSSSLTKED